MADLVHFHREDDVVTLTLDRPGRGNALVPELLAALRGGLARASQEAPAALVLAGKGRAFSAGGDVAAFHEHAGDRDELLRYAAEVVGELNGAILDLLAFPAPVLAAVNGAVTGGSTGLVLASDMVVMSERAFLQPYYGEMGFAPDGGWTALLPERIGAARALEVQYLNARLSAPACRDLGVASTVCAAEALAATVAERLATLRRMDRETLRTTRAHVWSEPRRAQVAAALEEERQAFLRLVVRPETLARMETFLGRESAAGSAAKAQTQQQV
ncbi:enoyl-CoA hydratase/isomerase family protein [Stappia taiwanensis]|uniref:Enoyl-CoA hydratase/isomerase family protein n=1 Tax=Stappia taiwanensis TaxID=992267 RepID=A0A838Y0D2_9HYPH|nr:enoyl-CoA hydratase/isomerase family protein [Stappia taiwanensis]MBA4612704.1 enoyl-CoA hydratase/isomerase family protein [Stappia taiwanensis]GGE90712.1 hypothetical protein GCM10007285_17750 [Stappia taiwanensis]